MCTSSAHDSGCRRAQGVVQQTFVVVGVVVLIAVVDRHQSANIRLMILSVCFVVNNQVLVHLYPEQASIFSDFLFSVVLPKLRSAKLPNLTVTWHFSLVQDRVKNAQTLTVKGMMIK